MAMLESVNSTMRNPAINGSWMPHPTTMQPPLTSQTSESGVPISQNTHQRAICPVANLARNLMRLD